MNVSIDYTLEELSKIVGGTLIRQNSSSPKHIVLDSRKVLFAQDSIFFCLHEARGNCIGFIDDLYEKGVVNFVIKEGSITAAQYPEANFIFAENVLKAFQQIAIYHRKKFAGIAAVNVIGITGSNGKTIVKEWLNQLLQPDYSIVRSPKSYNSQIGVPLSVLQLNADNTLAVFEAGISQPGEMKMLEEIIQPTIGILTNVGDAHNAGFKNRAQKIAEKIRFFKHCSALIFCEDDGVVNEQINSLKKENPDLELVTWSRNTAATLQIVSVEKQSLSTKIRGKYLNEEIEINIPFTDDASIENAITCWCTLLHLKIEKDLIAQRMKHLHAVEMRLELKHGINNCSIINDSYSADLHSLSIALNFLSQQNQHLKRTVILSDILESGKPDAELYSIVAAYLSQKKVHRLIAIGSKIKRAEKEFDFLPEKNFYASVNDFKKDFYNLHFGNESILIKGARIFEFEQIEQLLEQKAHQTVLSINLSAIAHNLKMYRQLLQPTTKIMAMVKAFSYGSGSYEIANLLQFNKVDYLAVAYADEGVELRKSGITIPIMVMNPEENSFNAIVQYNLEPEIFSFGLLLSFEKYLHSSALSNFPIHIKLDTGMHRLGFDAADINDLGLHLKENNLLKVQSVFTHLVSSEDQLNDEFTEQQSNLFLQCCETLQSHLTYTFLKHVANTTAISRHANLQMDMVRLGIGLYGVDSNTNMRSQLRNVSTLTTTVAQIRKVRAGETVGYGRKTKMQRDSVIATVRIGYADGYPRSLGNGIGKMLINNRLVNVVGNICMDMTMLDVTDLPDVVENNEVVVFGEDLPIETLANWAETIPYEIMTNISQRVKRIYYEE